MKQEYYPDLFPGMLTTPHFYRISPSQFCFAQLVSYSISFVQYVKNPNECK